MSQFHYGSIQILAGRPSEYKPDSLNSTMVRFKFMAGINKYNNWGFGLNSTMVRFKSSETKLYPINADRSQFNYGSIQIRTIEINVYNTYGVSIPLWFDSNSKI